MVAVKPGSIPTMIPRKVAQKTENRISGVINPQIAFTRSTTPNETLPLLLYPDMVSVINMPMRIQKSDYTNPKFEPILNSSGF
jgi:hypothetical protein